MSECVFSQVPLEVAQEWICYLDRWDLCIYRLICKKAESQSFEIFAKRYFSVLETSLMGSDLKRLEGISCSTRLRQHVKSIFIRDDCERNERWTPYARDAGHIWPRDDDRIIQTDAVGVTNLKKILAECRLCLDTIKMRDYGRDNRNINVEPLAELMRVLYDPSLAITSLTFERRTPLTAEASIELFKRRQGQNVAFGMLRCAKLILSSNSKLYWANEVFLRSPSLVNLTVTFNYPWMGEELQRMFLKTTISQLKRFCLSCSSISAHLILTILANSKETLTDLSFSMVTLRQGFTWRELLNKIRKDFTQLESFRMSFPREFVEGYEKSIMFKIMSKEDLPEEYRPGLEFAIRGPKSAPRVTSWHYKGPNTNALLEVMAAKAVYLTTRYT